MVNFSSAMKGLMQILGHAGPNATYPCLRLAYVYLSCTLPTELCLPCMYEYSTKDYYEHFIVLASLLQKPLQRLSSNRLTGHQGILVGLG